MGVGLVLIGCIGMFVIAELTSSSWLTHLLSNKTLNETVIHHLDLGVHYRSLELFIYIFCGMALTVMFT